MLFDLTKDAEHLKSSLHAANPTWQMLFHQDHVRFRLKVPSNKGFKLVMYLVGNKADLVALRKFAREDVEKAAAELGIKYAEGINATHSRFVVALRFAIMLFT